MTAFSQYIADIQKNLRAGNATEHTHRPALKTLIESFDPAIVATNEPKREDCGAPDYIVTKGVIPLGYVETKKVGEPLDDVAQSDQLKRYYALGNLLLTDYLEFRWYVTDSGGSGKTKLRMKARLATVGHDGKLRSDSQNEDDVRQLIEAFLAAEAAFIGKPKDLAERMARLARIIRPFVVDTLASEDERGALRQLMEGFRRVLLHDLTDEQFADMYTQTLCYGLFAARYSHKKKDGPFTRRGAAFDIPKTNPFLRDLFSHFNSPELEEKPYVWAVDDLADLLDHVDIHAVLSDFGKSTRRQDPIIHFYETFLAAYDPKMRESRGVYYTPEPVISYIVRSVDHVLKTDFGLADGLADKSKIKVADRAGNERECHRVQILDPATGTGTFLYNVINQIYESFKGNKGMWPKYVQEHLLPRLFGFELLIAPYAVAHLKLGLLLSETAYDFESDERLNVFLTNTLEEGFQLDAANAWGHRVAEEANAASRVKRDFPIMVVLGNPPYSGHSANKGKWIDALVHGKDLLTDKATANYFRVDGKPLGEKNPKWLNDDYVKFIRFAQWRIDQTGYGILAFITNHGYLDNPTFRGMRQSLMNTFDDIYILDLHGNSKKKERSPDGSKDENVFDIQQGVAIGIFVKKPGSAGVSPAKVRHADMWGTREAKNTVLGGSDVESTVWRDLPVSAPIYGFFPQDIAVLSEYRMGMAVNDVMPANNVGIVTARDHLTIHWSRDDVLSTARDFASLSEEKAREKYDLGPDVRDWKVTLAQADLRADGLEADHVVPILYRPFDTRFTYYTGQTRGFICMPRPGMMRNLVGIENLALLTTRQTRDKWDVLCTRNIMGHKSLSAYDITSVFPLYVYPDATGVTLFDAEPTTAPGGRRPNLAREFIADMEKHLGMSFVPDGKGDLQATFGPEDVFHYMYAVFHSPTYRTRYAEFLKMDFPRLPLTTDKDLFRALCALGEELAGLHLMEKTGPNLAVYPIALPKDNPSADKVEDVRYTEPGPASDNGRVWINKSQYFEGVSPQVWEFHVGGYQVCRKWLIDRKGRALAYDDLQHYQRIVAALTETIRLMNEIDTAIQSHGAWPIK